MKQLCTVVCILALSCVEANNPLSNLIEYNEKTCLEYLEKATDAELWDIFLEGQAKLFFDSEFQWINKANWWKESENVLEIGSGNGSYLYRLSSQFNEKKFRGIEILSQSVRQSNEQYSGTNLVFQEGDAEVLDNQLIHSANLILFRLTLQHLKDPTTALKNAAEYLLSNGYIVIIDSCDAAKRTSHPIPAIDEALQLVAEVQKKQGKGNRRVTLELLQTLETEKSPLNALYEIVFTNLDAQGNVLCDSIRFEGSENRTLYFNHSLLFLNLLQRTYHIPIDSNSAYQELKGYLNDEGAWTSPGMHFLVLKKKK